MSQDHGPIEEKNRNIMRAIADGLDEIFNPQLKDETPKPRTLGFALLVFPLGESPGGHINYICNGKREDMLVAMKEFIAKSEGMNMPITNTKN